MTRSSLFFVLLGAAIAVVNAAGCSSGGSGPLTSSQPAPPPTSAPAARWLYVDHNGTLYQYRLPLAQGSQPLRTLTEWPGLGVPPEISFDQYGNAAVASPKSIRFFHTPVESFNANRAYLTLKLTPAITEMGVSGADLADIEFDPNENLWLLNNLGAEITELRAPISKASVAAVTVGFGAPGSKTAGFTSLIQARFDVNAALYVYAASSTRARLFKISFPYSKPPGSVGIDLAQADFVDSSQWPPAAPNAPSLLLGQYLGQLQSPKPGSPPSPPVNVTAQFPQPFDPSRGRFPDSHIDSIVGALIADTNRSSLYTLDAGNGALSTYSLPMQGSDKPKITLACLGGPSNCAEKGEHVFLAP